MCFDIYYFYIYNLFKFFCNVKLSVFELPCHKQKQFSGGFTNIPCDISNRLFCFNAGLCTPLNICVRLAACAGLVAFCSLIHLDVMQTFVVFNEIYFNGINSCCLVQLLQSYFIFLRL